MPKSFAPKAAPDMARKCGSSTSMFATQFGALAGENEQDSRVHPPPRNGSKVFLWNFSERSENLPAKSCRLGLRKSVRSSQRNCGATIHFPNARI